MVAPELPSGLDVPRMRDRTPVIVVGAGGHARVVWDILIQSKDVHVIGFTDPAYRAGTSISWGSSQVPILGDDSVISAAVAKDGGIKVVLGLGAEALDIRKRLIDDLDRGGIASVCAVHPRAVVAVSASLGPGTVVMAGAVVNPFARTGRHCVLNTGATVDHDCVLGDNIFVQPGAHLGGAVRIGDHSIVGIGASVMERVSIGTGAIVGGGASIPTPGR